MKYQGKGLSLNEWDERWYETYWLITRQQPEMKHLKVCEMATDLMVKYHGHKPMRAVPEVKKMGLLKLIAVKLLKGKWDVLFPAVFKAAGEGQFGEPVKKVYWFMSKYAFWTGLVFSGLGAFADTVAAQYPVALFPELAWVPLAGRAIFQVGNVLWSSGLLIGATNSPWPGPAKKDH